MTLLTNDQIATFTQAIAAVYNQAIITRPDLDRVEHWWQELHRDTTKRLGLTTPINPLAHFTTPPNIATRNTLLHFPGLFVKPPGGVPLMYGDALGALLLTMDMGKPNEAAQWALVVAEAESFSIDAFVLNNAPAIPGRDIITTLLASRIPVLLRPAHMSKATLELFNRCRGHSGGIDIATSMMELTVSVLNDGGEQIPLLPVKVLDELDKWGGKLVRMLS